jgi:phage/plasmid-associated DNA primase
MRNFITGTLVPIERKFGPRFTIPNRLGSIITTNHQHAVALGLRDRRYFVLEIDPQHIGDEAYFKRLWDDIYNDGINEFLHLLLSIKLNDNWHPRLMPKTAEGYEERRMSSDTVLQWMQLCITADEIKLEKEAGYSRSINLNIGWAATDQLYESYLVACKQQGWRYPANLIVFGRTLSQILGPSYRCSAPDSLGKRPMGYNVPDAEKWQGKLDERLGKS